MKRTHIILPLLFSLSFMLGELSSCGGVNNNPVGIIIKDTKLDYAFGESYKEDNLKVYLNYSNNELKELSKEDYIIDTSNFNKMKPGSYLIKVSTKDNKYQSTYEVNVNVAKKLHLLMIGNSFSDDTSKYIYEISNSLGIKDVVVGNMYIGGCNIDTHYKNAINNIKAYEYRTYENGKWVTKVNTSIEEALNSYSWDYISLQQASGLSGIKSSLSNLDNLMEYLKDTATYKDFEFIWNMTWAYQQNSNHNDFSKYNRNQETMYKAIVSLVKDEILTRDFVAIIPSGTSIQNARSSFIGDNLTRDGFHLTYDLGRYIAGLTLAKTLTGKDINNIEFAPISVIDSYKSVALESVNNAYLEMFNVTKSKYLTEPELDVSELTELNLKPVCGAFYNSTDKVNFNKLITNNVSLSKKFIATKRFKKEELPVGSIIQCNKGYQYRPEGWKEDVVQDTRPDNITSKYFKVTEEFWDNYLYRAFNISKCDGSKLEKEYDLALDNFKIYIPKESYKEESNKFYSQDKELLNNNSLNIDDYTLYDYVPITGYYNSLNPDENVKDLEIELTKATSSLHLKFIATPILTRSNLPNNSLIILDEGYRYRADGYLKTGKPEVRPGNVTTNLTIIDDSWWLDTKGNEFIKRGINLSRSDSKVLIDDIYEHKSHLRIYIPNK